jgi:hypothetical protein
VVRSDDELRNAYDALGNLYRAIAALKSEYGEQSDVFVVLAEGPLHELEKITAEIQEFTGVTAVVRASAQLWMRLVGRKARWRETSASALTAFLDGLRKGVQAVANYNTSRELSGRPATDLQQACDFEVIAFLPGSLQVGVTLPEPQQRDLFREHVSTEIQWAEEAQRALSEYLAVAHWVASDTDTGELDRLVPDFPKRRVLLRAVKPLIPRLKGGIDYVQLSGRPVPGGAPIYLVQNASSRVTAALAAAVAETEERHTGEIREMDLDKRTFRLRNIEGRRSDLQCHIPDDLGPITATFLGKRATIVGTRTTPRQPLEIVDIEQLEAANSAGDGA